MALTSKLTPRDAEILALVRQGIAQTEIAELLGIAKNTVKTHLRIMLAREGVQSQIELVVRAGGLKFSGDRRLTKAESLVVRHVFQGMGSREIAEAVGLSVETVKNRLRMIYDKVGVWSRLELVVRLGRGKEVGQENQAGEAT